MAFLSKTDLRLFAAAVVAAGWLLLLFTGLALGGLVHGLLVLALVLVPWRAAPRRAAEVVEDSQYAVAEGRNGKTN